MTVIVVFLFSDSWGIFLVACGTCTAALLRLWGIDTPELRRNSNQDVIATYLLCFCGVPAIIDPRKPR